MKKLNTELSKTDANRVLDLIEMALACRNQDDFIHLIEQMKQLIHFSQARCGFGDSAEFPVKKMDAFQMVSKFPDAWEERYSERDYYLNDNVALTGFLKKGLVFWADCNHIDAFSTEKNRASMEIMEEASSAGLKDGWLYSLQGRRSTECAIISLAGGHVEKSLRSELILKHLLPHVGQALKTVMLSKQGKEMKLSDREAEILTWMASGKTAWEISVILKISHRTVEYHTGNILKKLDAVNARQAVAVGISLGLITL